MIRKSRALPRITLLFAITLGGLSSQGAEVLTLSQAYQAALQGTEAIPIQKSLVAQSEAGVVVARGQMLPNLSVGAAYAHQTYRATGSNLFYTPDEVETKLTLQQSIFDGKLYSGLEKSNYDVKSAKEALQAQKVSLFLNVAQAYYNVLNAQKKIQNLKTVIKLTQKQVRELKARARIGRSQRSDVLSTVSQLAIFNSQMAAALGQVTADLDQLSLATNLPLQGRYSLQAEMPDSAPPVSTFLSHLNDLPDLKTLTAQLHSQQESVKVAQAGAWPTLGTNADYYFSQTGYRAPMDWDAGVALTIPLFQGGTVSGEVAQAKAKQTQIQLQLAQARRSDESQIRANYDNFQSSMLQIESLKKAVEAAQKSYLSQVHDYRLSLVTNLDVLQSLTTLSNTKLSLDQTQVQAALNWAQLQASVGQIPN